MGQVRGTAGPVLGEASASIQSSRRSRRQSSMVKPCSAVAGRATVGCRRRCRAVVQAAFLLRLVLPPPAAGALGLAGRTARVQGAQPIEGKPRSCSGLYGNARRPGDVARDVRAVPVDERVDLDQPARRHRARRRASSARLADWSRAQAGDPAARRRRARARAARPCARRSRPCGPRPSRRKPMRALVGEQRLRRRPSGTRPWIRRRSAPPSRPRASMVSGNRRPVSSVTMRTDAARAHGVGERLVLQAEARGEHRGTAPGDRADDRVEAGVEGVRGQGGERRVEARQPGQSGRRGLRHDGRVVLYAERCRSRAGAFRGLAAVRTRSSTEAFVPRGGVGRIGRAAASGVWRWTGSTAKSSTVLQADAIVSIAEIADRVGLSQTPCWKRIQRLEATGVIQRRVALLDPEKIGLGLTVFVSIQAPDHSEAWLPSFAETRLGHAGGDGVLPDGRRRRLHAAGRRRRHGGL